MAIRSRLLLAAFFHVARSKFCLTRAVLNNKNEMANVFPLISHRRWRKSHINPQLISPRAFTQVKSPRIRLELSAWARRTLRVLLTKSINFNSETKKLFLDSQETSIWFAFWLWTRRQLGLFYCLFPPLLRRVLAA